MLRRVAARTPTQAVQAIPRGLLPTGDRERPQTPMGTIGDVETLLWSLFAVTAVMALITCIVVALMIRAVRRSVRVVPEVPSKAPVSWQASIRHHARLHRQLQATVGSVRLALESSVSELQLRPLARELEAHACALDDQLAVAARSPSPARGRMLRELDGECRALTEAARRIIALSSESAVARSGVARVTERLDALDAALAELDGRTGTAGSLARRAQPGSA